MVVLNFLLEKRLVLKGLRGAGETKSYEDCKVSYLVWYVNSMYDV